MGIGPLMLSTFDFCSGLLYIVVYFSCLLQNNDNRTAQFAVMMEKSIYISKQNYSNHGPPFDFKSPEEERYKSRVTKVW